MGRLGLLKSFTPAITVATVFNDRYYAFCFIFHLHSPFDQLVNDLSNGYSWSESVWIKRDAETWQTEKGADTLSNTNEPSAAALIRAQGQQIRRETAWEYLQRRCGLRGDAGGDNKGAAPGIPE